MSDAIKYAFAAIAAACVAALFYALMPTHPLGPEHGRARALLANDEGVEAAEIYGRLAEGGDAVALNNLAVLKFRGTGIAKDGAEAARLFQRSAELGLVRARLNILLATTYACRSSGIFEKKVERLEKERLALLERAETPHQTKYTFEELFEHSLRFLSSPWNIWRSGSCDCRDRCSDWPSATISATAERRAV